MKVKIKKDKESTFMTINDIQVGKGISSYKIEQEGINKPILTLNIFCDELLFECEQVEVKQIKEGDNN